MPFLSLVRFRNDFLSSAPENHADLTATCSNDCSEDLELRIDELMPVEECEWDKEFAALSARALAEEIFVNVQFRYGHLRARAYQLQVDGSTIRVRLVPLSLLDIEDGGICVRRPEIKDGAFHVLSGQGGEKLITLGFPLCQHLEFGELQISTNLELFEIEDSPILYH